MGDVSEFFLKPLMRHFNLPPGASDDPEGWERDYDESLGTFGDDALRRAARIIREERTGARTFPLIADCNAACKRAFDELHSPRSNKSGARNDDQAIEDGYPEWGDLRRQQAWSLMRCDLGKEAARDMWVVPLFDFCRENRRLPDRHEVERLIQKGIKTAELVGILQETESGTEFAAIIKNKVHKFYFARHNTLCKKIGADEFVIGG